MNDHPVVMSRFEFLTSCSKIAVITPTINQPQWRYNPSFEYNASSPLLVYRVNHQVDP